MLHQSKNTIMQNILYRGFVSGHRRLGDITWNIFRRIRCARWKKPRAVPSIISQNCIGGCMYHDLGMPFLSPTINCFMSFEDFVKFCEGLNFYLSCELNESKIRGDYPIGILHDIIIHFMHYKSFEEARFKWESRKERIDFNNIRIIATDRDGCNLDLVNRFLKLPYKKILFSHTISNNPDIVYIKGYENEKQVGTLIEKRKGGIRPYDQFDWVDFICQK